MKDWLRGAAWVMFGAIAYLMVAEALRPWVRWPDTGNIWFTVIFLGFSLLHCATLEGWRLTGIFFAVSGVVTYSLEEIGVRTGWIYGAYHYGTLLGPKLGHVPVVIPLAWFMMVYPAWRVARALLAGVDFATRAGIVAQAGVAAVVMTAWDLVMDPGMARGGSWTWERGGAYFGVPLQNYVGWLGTTFLVYLVAGYLWRGRREIGGRWFSALPLVVYGLFALQYVTGNEYPELGIMAAFVMGFPVGLALLRTALGRSGVS